MDKYTLHGLFTVVLFVAFVLLWRNAWRKQMKSSFDEAAKLPLQDDEV